MQIVEFLLFCAQITDKKHKLKISNDEIFQFFSAFDKLIEALVIKVIVNLVKCRVVFNLHIRKLSTQLSDATEKLN